MDFGPEIDENLVKAKYVEPTPVQMCSMKLIEQGNDIMACAETGSGKTAAFLLPLIKILKNDPNQLNDDVSEDILRGDWPRAK